MSILSYIRTDSRLAQSQWETALLNMYLCPHCWSSLLWSSVSSRSYKALVSFVSPKQIQKSKVWVQYIPRNMHTVFALLCFVVVIHWLFFFIFIRLTSLALWQSNDCPSASKATLMNMDKYFMWIHYERLHNHNKAKHNKTVCIFLGIYCISMIRNGWYGVTDLFQLKPTLSVSSWMQTSTIPIVTQRTRELWR